MQLDIRLPMGLLFLALGAVLTIFGLVSDPVIYSQHSLGRNINVVWGAMFVLFGSFMCWLSRRRKGDR